MTNSNFVADKLQGAACPLTVRKLICSIKAKAGKGMLKRTREELLFNLSLVKIHLLIVKLLVTNEFSSRVIRIFH